MPWPPSQGSGQRFVSAPGTDTVRLGTTRSYSSGAASRHPSARSNSTGNAGFRNIARSDTRVDGAGALPEQRPGSVEARWALLEERCHALARVGRLAGSGHELDRVGVGLVLVEVDLGVESLLAQRL